MIFGLPWFAYVAILVPLGGMYYAYKEKELKVEEKRYGNAKEFHELRKLIVNLKGRVENLEAIISDTKSTAKEPEIPLDDIEIRNDLEESDHMKQSSRVRG